MRDDKSRSSSSSPSFPPLFCLLPHLFSPRVLFMGNREQNIERGGGDKEKEDEE